MYRRRQQVGGKNNEERDEEEEEEGRQWKPKSSNDVWTEKQREQ